MSVVSLVGIVVFVLVTDGLAADGAAAVEAGLGGVGHGYVELAGVNVANSIRSIPCYGSGTNVELYAVEGVVTVVGCSTGKFPCHVRIKAAVISSFGIPVGSVMSVE